MRPCFRDPSIVKTPKQSFGSGKVYDHRVFNDTEPSSQEDCLSRLLLGGMRGEGYSPRFSSDTGWEYAVQHTGKDLEQLS